MQLLDYSNRIRVRFSWLVLLLIAVGTSFCSNVASFSGFDFRFFIWVLCSCLLFWHGLRNLFLVFLSFLFYALSWAKQYYGLVGAMFQVKADVFCIQNT
jgi:hypothetical protein